MAGVPRRETLVALRARRKAFRVATDVVLAQRSRLIRKQCLMCRESFLTDRHEQALCEHCEALDQANWPAPPTSEQTRSPREAPVPLRWHIAKWIMLTVMCGIILYGLIVSDTWRDLTPPDLSEIAPRIAAADELRKTDPRGAIKEYEKVRELVEGKRIRDTGLSKKLADMDRHWAEAVRELRNQSATRP